MYEQARAAVLAWQQTVNATWEQQNLALQDILVAVPPGLPTPSQETALDGVLDFGADVINGAASFGKAALNNPDLVLAAAGGIGLTALSGGGEFLGVGLSLTGGGAVAGVPLAAVSAAGIAAGTTTTAVALAAMAEQAAGADRVEPIQVNSSQNPPGAKEGWESRPQNNNQGTVYQEPGAQGNRNMFRDANPNPDYPNGYVRFYNEHGQPIDLNGKPGSNADTHIPKNPDGTYPLPKGW